MDALLAFFARERVRPTRLVVPPGAADDATMRPLARLLDAGASSYVPSVVLAALRTMSSPASSCLVDRAHGLSLVTLGDVDADDAAAMRRVVDAASAFFRSQLAARGAGDAPPRITAYYAPVDAVGGKALHDPTRPLGALDVNSGVTWWAADGSAAILVYRREEAQKVMVHELVHAHGLDRFSPEFDARGRALAARHNVRSSVPVRLNETYTELLASFVYTAFEVAAASHDAAELARRCKRLKRHFERQADRIMCAYYFGGRRALHQDTHVFEYYVAKATAFRGRSAGALLELLLSSDVERRLLHAVERGVEAYMSTFSCSLRMLPSPPQQQIN